MPGYSVTRRIRILAFERRGANMILMCFFLFEGTKYYRLSNNLKVEPGYPKDMSIWTRMKTCPSINQIVGSEDPRGSASVSVVTMGTLLMSLVVAMLQVV